MAPDGVVTYGCESTLLVEECARAAGVVAGCMTLGAVGTLGIAGDVGVVWGGVYVSGDAGVEADIFGTAGDPVKPPPRNDGVLADIDMEPKGLGVEPDGDTPLGIAGAEPPPKTLETPFSMPLPSALNALPIDPSMLIYL